MHSEAPSHEHGAVTIPNQCSAGWLCHLQTALSPGQKPCELTQGIVWSWPLKVGKGHYSGPRTGLCVRRIG